MPSPTEWIAKLDRLIQAYRAGGMTLSPALLRELDAFARDGLGDAHAFGSTLQGNPAPGTGEES